MPRGRTTRPAHDLTPTPQEIQRHQDMVRCVFDWMNRTQGTQQLLVRCIEEFWRRRGDATYHCDRSLLSRIINPVTPHIPTASRLKSMRILQATMIVCAPSHDPNVIASAEEQDAAWSSDEEQVFKIHRARLRQLREHGRESLFQSLHRIGEFCASARWMDDTTPSNELGETLRQRASENVLLALAALIDPGDAKTCLRARLEGDGVATADATRLEDQQVQRVRSILASHTPPGVNMNAYAGAVLFHCGLREEGMNTMLDAVAHSHDLARRHDPHWETLLDLLEKLLQDDDAQAGEWATRAARMAQAAVADDAKPGAADLLRRAWQMVRVPIVREHWRHTLPGLIERLDTQDAPEMQDAPAAAPVPSAPVELRKTIARKVTRAITVFITTFVMMAEGSLALAWSSYSDPASSNVAPQLLEPARSHDEHVIQPLSQQLSIRGREASRPEPSPPRDRGDRGSAT